MLRARLLCVLAVSALFVCAGCDSKPTHESVMKESLDKLNEVATILEGVKDEASAKEAKPKLAAIAARLKELKTKMDQLPKPSADEEKRLREKYEPQVRELLPKLQTQMARVALDPKLGPLIKDSLPNEAPAAATPGM
jgi:outer membrane PBP1 activator LpoA protein